MSVLVSCLLAMLVMRGMLGMLAMLGDLLPDLTSRKPLGHAADDQTARGAAHHPNRVIGAEVANARPAQTYRACMVECQRWHWRLPAWED